METIYVQYADATEQVVVSVFMCPQDEAEYPHQGTVERSDPRYAAFYEAMPSGIREYLPAPM